MDDRPATSTRDARPGAADGGLRELLPELGRTLCRPALALHSELGRIAAGPADVANGPARALLQQCEDLIGLTQGFLSLAESDLGGAEPRPVATTTEALLRAIDDRFAAEARAHGLDWSCSPAAEGDDGPIQTDPALCLEVAAHLVGNALKFTPSGGSIRVAAKRDGASWLLTVADTGPGIPEPQREQVLEPFFRLPREEMAGIPGHGLGLAACAVLVRGLGGTIRFAPDDSHGTTVLVRLPAALGPDRAAETD